MLAQPSCSGILCLSKAVEEESVPIATQQRRNHILTDICFVTISTEFSDFSFLSLYRPCPFLGDNKREGLSYQRQTLNQININILTVNEARLLGIWTFGYNKCHLCILVHGCFMKQCYLQLSNVVITMATPHSLFLLFCLSIC